ncbi:MAG: TMEM165/GDT1 family protein [Thermoplasmata archaeon]
MEGLLPFSAALGLVLLLELGDKSQLATISMATRHPWLPVWAGASLGLVAVTAIGATLGAALAIYLTAWMTAIQVGAGMVFIAFGLFTYIRQEAEVEAATRRGAFAEALTFNFLAELGDKTQLAVIVLAATAVAPISVLGASLALVLMVTLSVVIGTSLAKHLGKRWLRLVASGLFLAVGVYLIVEALLL